MVLKYNDFFMLNNIDCLGHQFNQILKNIKWLEYPPHHQKSTINDEIQAPKTFALYPQTPNFCLSKVVKNHQNYRQ